MVSFSVRLSESRPFVPAEDRNCLHRSSSAVSAALAVPALSFDWDQQMDYCVSRADNPVPCLYRCWLRSVRPLEMQSWLAALQTATWPAAKKRTNTNRH